MAIRLVVGLGNPGREYTHTRHNVGAWFITSLAQQAGHKLRQESKFLGLVGRITVIDHCCWLLCPTTYMNNSGQAIQVLTKFYKINPSEILVAHDELDFPAGKIRLKERGGHGGHNGLRNTISQLHSEQFYRLRIGIGHPGHKDRVTPYVLGVPSARDNILILAAIERGIAIIPDLVNGEFAQAMRKLHG